MTNFRVFRRFIAKAMFIQNIKKIVAFAALMAVSMTMGLSAARAGNSEPTLAEDGMTMVCVTHEIGFAYHVANKVCFLHDGQILEQGAPQNVLKTPETARVREFLDGHSLFKLPN